MQSFSFAGTANAPDVGIIANPVEAVITAIKTDGTLWRLTTGMLQPNTGSYVQVPILLVQP